MSRSVVSTLGDLPGSKYVVTIGSFDGVHRGHQYLIQQVANEARQRNTSALGITFDPLPAEVLRPELAPPRLCSIDDRIDLMLQAGIDQIVVLPFSQEMAKQSAGEFLRELHQYASPVSIIVGEDFAFGHKRQGTSEFLAQHAGEYGYDLHVVSRTNPEEAIEWSSSAIRAALADSGNVKRAAEALGRPFRLTGEVENGDHRGRKLGYPTANLRLSDRFLIPADGIYAGFALLEGDDHQPGHPSLIYVGTRPTFGGSQRVVEVYLLDFDRDLYGRTLTVDFIDRIRGDRAFSSSEELVEQMEKDEAAGRKIFSELGLSSLMRDS